MSASNLIWYFGYGSNMFTPRLRQRVGSAQPICIGELTGYSLRWHKRSADLSGKCDAFATGQGADVTLGVLFQIDPNEKPLLDRVEGLGQGYGEQLLDIRTPTGTERAYAYLATDVDANLRPYDWYKEYVIRGARLHGLPNEYIHTLAGVAAIPDSNVGRSDREWSFIRSHETGM